MKNLLKIFCISTLCILMLLGCSAGSSTTDTVDKTTKKFIESIENPTPDEAIKNYYAYQLDTNSEGFEKSVYPSDNLNTDLLNARIKSYDIKKISLNAIHQVDKKDNLAVALCSFKTSMGNIKEENLDFEFLNLINKDGIWYVINDINALSSDEQNTLQDMIVQLSDKSLQREDIQKIADAQLKFEDKYSDYLEKSGKKLDDYIKKEGIAH